MHTTTNLYDFGLREIEIAAIILREYSNGNYCHPFWSGEGVQLYMNKLSGFVFLSDSEYNVLMLNNDKLEPFYTLPHSGIEGFLDEILIDENFHPEDVEFLNSIYKFA